MTGENGTPPTPDWTVEPHDCPILDFLAARRLRTCDQVDPPNIVRGTE